MDYRIRVESEACVFVPPCACAGIVRSAESLHAESYACGIVLTLLEAEGETTGPSSDLTTLPEPLVLVSMRSG